MSNSIPIKSINYEYLDRVVDTLCAAIHEYPVVRQMKESALIRIEGPVVRFSCHSGERF